MTKDELQEIAAERLATSKRLVCMWATGVGKSRVLLRFLEEHPSCNCLILVPEQNNIENWREEFRKFNVADDKVTIICYASLHKYTNTKWDVLCLDEVPHMDTYRRMSILMSVSGEYILALGAVVDQDEMRSLESVYGSFDVSKVTLNSAIKLGFIPVPNVVVMHMRMDENMKMIVGNGKKFVGAKNYAQIHKDVQDAVDAYNANPCEFNKRRMFQAGLRRKRFLGSMKEYSLSLICKRLIDEGKRFLCFCSSVEQAERLGGEKSFTSKSPKSFAHLDKFNNHEINSLYVVGKLIEGQNLKDIDCGVIGQLGGTQRITVQEIGRIMRSQNPVIYVPVFDNTKDDSFLYTLTANIPANYITHVDF